MDDDKIGGFKGGTKFLSTFSHRSLVNIDHSLRESDVRPLQTVMKRLGSLVVDGRTLDHLPRSIQSNIVHQRHQPIENLGHPPADAG